MATREFSSYLIEIVCAKKKRHTHFWSDIRCAEEISKISIYVILFQLEMF